MKTPKEDFEKIHKFPQFSSTFFLGFASCKQWILPYYQNIEGFPTFFTCLFNLNLNNVTLQFYFFRPQRPK
jgi:hypothetical protein